LKGGGRTKFGCQVEEFRRIGFGCASEQSLRALFLFANMKGINHPLDKDKTLAGKDCFSGYVKEMETWH
jgi:hypothetical protein